MTLKLLLSDLSVMPFIMEAIDERHVVLTKSLGCEPFS
jgi:hypothetical protein